MQVENPQTITGKLINRKGKYPLIRITCPHCGLEHTLAPGLRVPPCGGDRAEYIVQAIDQEKEDRR
jgi:hypothetical protein